MSQHSLPTRSEASSTESLTETVERSIFREPQPRVSLIFVHRDGAEVAILLPDLPLVIGRCPPADLCIADRTLSREHARFLLEGGRIFVEDLGSRNGTWMAGARLEKGVRGVLDIGSEVTLGGVLARVQLLGASSDEQGSGARPLPRSPPAEATPTRPWADSTTARGSDAIVAGAAMRGPLETVSRVAPSRIPVILHGETGTGKEVLAHLIHDGGPRRGRRMVRVNCGAISAQLVESTLFGHEKGAFTGAFQQQKGVFEEADKGTVFLDEIGELPPAAQAALLRVLETGCFSRVGSAREIAVDVRLIAATHRDLEAMVEAGSFREDLFYRLNTIMLVVPPLRERIDEIEPLAARFLEQANKANGSHVRGIAPAALELLRAYRWPGNVRELRNAIERAVVIARADQIQPADLPARVRAVDEIRDASSIAPPPPSPSPPAAEVSGELRTQMHQYEAQILMNALNATGWSRAEAARRLGMPLRTLTHKIKVLGIKSPGR